MEGNYSKAYKEVVEILKYVPEESVNKIPKEMREMFEAEKSETYNFQVDIEKPFEEQELLEETKAIFANIFRDYWATDYQKERILAKEQQDRQKLEEEKRTRYDPDVLKNRRISNEAKQEENHNNNLPVEVKKQNFFKKLIGVIKGFFKKNKIEL